MTSVDDRRDKALRRGMATSIAYRATTAIGPLLIVPIALDSLGKASFGIWMTVVAVTSALAFADLGLGNSLMTELSKLRGATPSAERSSQMRRVVGSTYAIVTCISFVLAIVIEFLIWYSPWSAIEQGSGSDWRPIATVAVAIFLLNIPASIIVRIMFAHEMPSASYAWQTVGPILSLAGAYAAAGASLSPAYFVALSTIGPLASNVLCTAWWFGRPGENRIHAADISLAGARSLLKLGSTFLLISLAMTLSTNLDLPLISRELGTDSAADFSVPWRIYGQLGLMLSLLCLPFWPAAGAALASGNTSWVRRRVRVLVIVNMSFMIPISVAGVLWGGNIIHLWVGNSIVVSDVAMAGFGVWWCLLALSYPIFMAQNGAGLLWPQLAGWCSYAAVSILAKVGALSTGHSWEWIPAISAICYACTVLPSALFGYRLALREAASRMERSVSV